VILPIKREVSGHRYVVAQNSMCAPLLRAVARERSTHTQRCEHAQRWGRAGRLQCGSERPPMLPLSLLRAAIGHPMVRLPPFSHHLCACLRFRTSSGGSCVASLVHIDPPHG
jgi:hypothetical protein